jgi:glycosyltransferase involved in cell wall biosynthesis
MHAVLAVTNDITADQRVRRTAAALQKLGLHVTVIGRKLQHYQSGEDPFQTMRMSLWFRKGPLFYAEFNLRLFSRLLRIPCNLMVANDLDTLPGVYLVSRLRHLALLYDSHELFTGVPELVHRPVVRKIWETIEAFLLPRVRYACTVSPLIAEYYNHKYGIDMEVIRNLPVSENAPAESPSLRVGNEKIILYQGALNLGRGLESAIRAMQFTRGIRLVLVGTGDVEASLKQLVQSLDLSALVTFTGRISPDALPGYTRQADLGISLEEDLGLNYRYAMPNKVFDYIMSGVPVLVSDLPMLRSLVETYGIGKVVASSDPSALAVMFHEMMESHERAGWKRNLAAAATELCWENEEPRLIALIRKSMGTYSPE